MEKLGIQIHRKPGRSVSLADGGRCSINGFCHESTMTVQGHQFKADFFAIPLTGFDVVLGIRWLNALGRVIWDGPNKTIEFLHDLTPVIWHKEAGAHKK